MDDINLARRSKYDVSWLRKYHGPVRWRPSSDFSRCEKKYLKNTGKIQENTGKYREPPDSFSRGALTLLGNAETEWTTPRWFAGRMLMHVTYVDRMNGWGAGLVES